MHPGRYRRIRDRWGWLAVGMAVALFGLVIMRPWDGLDVLRLAFGGLYVAGGISLAVYGKRRRRGASG